MKYALKYEEVSCAGLAKNSVHMFNKYKIRYARPGLGNSNERNRRAPLQGHFISLIKL